MTIDLSTSLADVEKGMLRWWLHLRGDRTMPTREDFDPLDIGNRLGWIHLLEPIGAEDVDTADFRYLVFSSRPSVTMAPEMNRKLVSDWDDGRLSQALYFYRFALRAKAPVWLSLGEYFRKEYLCLSRITMPFGVDGKVTHLMTHMVHLAETDLTHSEPMVLTDDLLKGL